MSKQSNVFRLYKRGEIYHAYFSFIQNGERIQFRETTHTTDKAEAEEYCLNRIQKFQNISKNKHTIDEVFGRFFEEKGQYQKSPYNLQKRLLKFINFFGHSLQFDNLTPEHITNYINMRKIEGVKNSTINRELTDLTAIINKCKIWKWKIPDLKISDFKLKTSAENIKYFTHEEVNKIIQASPPHLKDIVSFAVYTGLRKNNILSLCWNEIDFENNQIKVLVKGNKYHIIPLITKVKEIIDRQPHINEYVFNFKGRPIKDIKTSWRNTLKRAKVDYKNFHTLRHTCATWLVMSRIDIGTISKILGHSNIKITQRYAHVLDEQKRTALESITI